MIDQSLLVEIQRQIQHHAIRLPFSSGFEVRERYDSAWEASAYVISKQRSELSLEESLLLLLERLEYAEQEWEWEREWGESQVQAIRVQVLNRILDQLLQRATFENIESVDLMTRIAETQLADLFSIRVLTPTLQHALIHDEWNLFPVFIRNSHHDHLLVWYTTA